MDITAAILAGGMSRRFDGDKVLAEVDGLPMIQHVINQAQGYAGEVFIVAKESAKFRDAGVVTPVVIDAYKEQCPLVGIVTALENAVYDDVFIISADSPFFRGKFIRLMQGAIDMHQAVIPSVDGKVHPLHGIYRKCAIKPLKEMIEIGDYKMMNALRKLDVLYLGSEFFVSGDNALETFRNINRREDLQV